MEEWKDVKNYKGFYKVSNNGRVLSLPRVIIMSSGKQMSVVGRQLRCRPFGKHSYVQVNLSDTSKGKGGSVFVHVLVATAFLKKPKGTDRVCHKDDIGSNNKVKNLYWGTASSNAKDSYRNGKNGKQVMPKGTEVYNAVPDNLVRKVLRLRKNGKYLKDIAVKVNLNYCTIQAICFFKGRFKEFQSWNS